METTLGELEYRQAMIKKMEHAFSFRKLFSDVWDFVSRLCEQFKEILQPLFNRQR